MRTVCCSGHLSCHACTPPCHACPPPTAMQPLVMHAPLPHIPPSHMLPPPLPCTPLLWTDTCKNINHFRSYCFKFRGWHPSPFWEILDSPLLTQIVCYPRRSTIRGMFSFTMDMTEHKLKFEFSPVKSKYSNINLNRINLNHWFIVVLQIRYDLFQDMVSHRLGTIQRLRKGRRRGTQLKNDMKFWLTDLCVC